MFPNNNKKAAYKKAHLSHQFPASRKKTSKESRATKTFKSLNTTLAHAA